MAEDIQEELISRNYNKFRTSPGLRTQGQDDVESIKDAKLSGTLFFGQQAAAMDPSRTRDLISPRQMAPRSSYYGQALIDEDGYVVRGLYSIDTETAEQQMLKFSNVELALWAVQAKRTGFYSGAEPSSMILTRRGYNNTDINAMSNFMRYGNQTGFVVRSLLMQMDGWSGVQEGGGTKVKVTAPEDIRFYLDQAWLSRFGRRPNKSDIDSAISAIQSRERSASAQGQSSPSTAVLAKAQAEKTNRSEGASYQLGNAMQLAFKYLGGD